MDTLFLFSAALNLDAPWRVERVEFLPSKEKPSMKELHIYVGFARGGKFHCPEEGCVESMTAYDTSERTWRHLDFFQYKTYLHAALPRIRCKEHGTKTVSVPCARPNCGFTLLFEGWLVELSKHLPVAAIARMVDEHGTRLWKILHHYVEVARSRQDLSAVDAIGMDETSRKGHNYITIAVDLKRRNVLYVTEGKDHEMVGCFVEDFRAHGASTENVGVITCDMSLGFRKGILENFPEAHTIIDKFHVIKHCNEAVDKVRKEEAKTNELLRRTKYIWLKNEKNLTENQREKKTALCRKHLRTARAYCMRIALQEIYETCMDKEHADERLRRLCSWMMHSRLEPMKEFAWLVRRHSEEILNYFKYKYTNAVLEGMNRVIQNLKCRARGFRNMEYFKTMFYLVCGKLDLDVVVAQP